MSRHWSELVVLYLKNTDVFSDLSHQLFLRVGDCSRGDQGAWPCRRSNSIKVVDMAVDDRSYDEWVHGEMNGQCTGPAVSAPRGVPVVSHFLFNHGFYSLVGHGVMHCWHRASRVCTKFQTWTTWCFLSSPDTGSDELVARGHRHNSQFEACSCPRGSLFCRWTRGLVRLARGHRQAFTDAGFLFGGHFPGSPWFLGTFGTKDVRADFSRTERKHAKTKSPSSLWHPPPWTSV